MPDLDEESQQANSQSEAGTMATHPQNAAVIMMETEDEAQQIPSLEVMLQLNVWKLLPVYGAIFLAPIIIVLGLTASHGDSWKIMFVVYCGPFPPFMSVTKIDQGLLHSGWWLVPLDCFSIFEGSKSNLC
jgi:hypothetical protein